MKTEEFDEEFLIHYETKSLKVPNSINEKAHVVVFEKKNDYNDTKAFIFNHGATSIADKNEYQKEAQEIMNDKQFNFNDKLQIANMLRDRGNRYDDLPISYLESRKLESAVDSWRRVRYHMGSNHPKYTVSVSFGDRGLYILAPDSQGRSIMSATVSKHNELVDEALVAVGSQHNELWSISHSMGGLNSLAILMDQAKSGSNRIARAFIADMLLFPGDFNANMLLEFLIGMHGGKILSRMLVQLVLHETEWRETNPLGKHFLKLKDFPPTLLHSNTESIWKFDLKHNELMAVARDIGADQIQMIQTPTSHSFFAGKAVADFFATPSTSVSVPKPEPTPVPTPAPVPTPTIEVVTVPEEVEPEIVIKDVKE